MDKEELRHSTSDLLAHIGFRDDFNLQPLKGGANNRVFRVNAKGFNALLKVYFRHPGDPRDRLKTEFSFASFAWENGVQCIARPLACDSVHNLGLYGFIEGRQIVTDDITLDFIYQALNFYHELNLYKRHASAQALPEASESCFTIEDHLHCVERRLKLLEKIDDLSEINHEAINFIRDELLKTWMRLAEHVRRRAVELGFALNTAIDQQDKCISPSDFGFHNAILDSNGKIYFIDFEYAGWDDPVKMICDFFCQPEVPVPAEYYDIFIKRAISNLSKPEMHLQRISFLMPIHRIKWCCIMLNEFLAVGKVRRLFALNDIDIEKRKAEQLEKARHVLQGVSW